MVKKGNVFVFSGPSGVGKGTLLKEILQIMPDIKLSVSATTRTPRSIEVEGVNYFFTTKEKFTEQIENNEFVEWAEFAGNYYGTYLKTVKDSQKSGNDIVLEIEVQGAMQIREKIPEAILIFILPPSLDELEKRLLKRNTETRESIDRRLSIVKKELTLLEKFDHNVVNEDLNQAVGELIEIINSERQKV
ncbi:MAG: guanylate kinase [bacterium]